MRALLNALGVTVWGSIAIVLAVALAMFGYRASLNYKDMHSIGAPSPAAVVPVIHPFGQGDSLESAPAARSIAPVAPTRPAPPSPAPDPDTALTTYSTRTQLYRAVESQDYAHAAEYGQDLYGSGNATAEDLALIGFRRDSGDG
jgi:hypothetical protein